MMASMVTVETSMSHISDTNNLKSEKAYQIFAPIDESQFPRTNIKFQMSPRITVRDARGNPQDFALEKQGFQFLPCNFSDEDLDADSICGPKGDTRVSLYLRNLQAQLQQALEAEKVILYDWRLRQHLPSSPAELVVPGANRSLSLAPARHVHADESGESAYKIVMEHLTEDEKENCDKGLWRMRIVNIWKPLVSVISDSPLAVCDQMSVREEDWILCDQIHEDRVDESMYLKHQPQHRWYWLSEQRRDEMTLFVVFDSAKFDPAGPYHEASTPHASFENPLAMHFGRQSIEVRSIVLNRSVNKTMAV